MCGLIAVVSKKLNGFTNDQREIFDNLLFVDQLRGKDSTGMFLVTNEGELELAKEASNATVFREKAEYKALLGQSFRKGAALVGHNRSATKGSIIDVNAHPFVVDDQITLIHNGTLWGDHKTLANTEVDSHAIACQIHKYKGDVPTALKTLTGAYALIWHNFEAKTLNFIRNNQRPLHWVECGDCWLWASESNMLDWMLARYDVKPVGEIALLEEDTLVTYTQSHRGWDVDSKKLDLAVYTPPYKYSYKGPDNGLYGEDSPSYDRVIEAETKRIPLRYSSTVDEIRKFESDFASKLGCHTPNSVFTEEISELSYGECVNMKCLDYRQINSARAELGYHIYGTLVKNPNVMVKVHMPSTTSDNTLLDLTVNERHCVTLIRNKGWCIYLKEEQRTAIGDGYTMLTGDRCVCVTDIEENVCAV